MRKFSISYGDIYTHHFILELSGNTEKIEFYVILYLINSIII